jgi:hypothetical protein
LTTLATFYIPLSFIASIFGMNVTQFDPSISVQIWIYFVVALPVTAASMFLVWNWQWLLERVAFKQRQPSWYSRVWPKQAPSISRGVAMAGGMVAAVQAKPMAHGGGK